MLGFEVAKSLRLNLSCLWKPIVNIALFEKLKVSFQINIDSVNQ